MTPDVSRAKRAREDAATLVRKLWQYCNVLRDDGLSYPDYVEQLTYLLFLKMSDEQAGGPVPAEYAWQSFAGLETAAMHRHYARVLSSLGERDGMLGLIFRNAKNKIRDPAKLRLLIVDLIGQTTWTGLSVDVKGNAYEGLLEKNARDTKSGAGQYFTPRPLIEAIVECVDPQLGEVVCDPACGTAGFLLAAHEHMWARNPRMSRAQRRHLATSAIRGVELVQEVARLAAMNLLLHGLSGTTENELPITCEDSLREPPKTQVDVVLTNPPFGTKGSVTYAQERRALLGEDTLTVVRPDFWVQTANKQLNFLQHIVALLKPGGRAAVIVPDNVLFETGAAATIRRRLLETCHVHALLRLPSGLFYAQGVKANVLFFSRLPIKDKSLVRGRLWVYDLRSENRFSLKANPLRREDLDEFVVMYKENHHGGRDKELIANARSRTFDTAALLLSEGCRLDIAWAGEAEAQERRPGLSRLDEISRSIASDLERALELITNTRSRRL
jgi:type I restriction enzyme M protein